MIGSSIGNYKILEHLNGTEKIGIYRAVDILLNRDVCVKVLDREFVNQPDVSERFRFEAAILAKIVHPGVPELHSLTAVDGRLFMITEFLSGKNLDKVLSQNGKITSEKATAIFTQILECLKFVHQAGVTHGNLTTKSIFLTETGDIKILGFGIVENLIIDEAGDDILTELIPGSDAGKDVRAAAQIIFESVTGEKLFPRKIREIERHLRTVTPAVSPQVLKAVLKVFKLQFAGKFQSAEELLNEISVFDFEKPGLTGENSTLAANGFNDRAENGKVAEYFIDFSEKKKNFVKRVFQRDRSESLKRHKVTADAPVNWKLARKNLWVGGAGVLTIFFLHFFFQISFTQSEVVQINKDLTEIIQPEERQILSPTEEVSEVVPIISEDPFYNRTAESNDEPILEDSAEELVAESEKKTRRKSARQEVTAKPKVIDPPFQIRQKSAVSRNPVKRKTNQESRAERLRRAEKMLTGG